jgi:hypothetical protein
VKTSDTSVVIATKPISIDLGEVGLMQTGRTVVSEGRRQQSPTGEFGEGSDSP